LPQALPQSLPQKKCDPPTVVPFHCAAWQLKSLIQLNFQNLSPFTIVASQYQMWGIEFTNAIALQPSNPAFEITQMGLLPLKPRSSLQIHFQQPRQLVNLQGVRARQIRIQGYDAEDRLIDDQRLGELTYLQAATPPSTASTVVPFEMQIQNRAITRIELISATPFLVRQLICS
jgi:hypothetical protein